MNNLQQYNKGIKVKARNKSEIMGLAQAFRKKVCKSSMDKCLDILTVLEIILPRLFNMKFEFHPMDNDEMGDIEAAMSPDKMQMFIRQDVYEALHAGEPRARFTIAHEIGHFVLHDGIALARGASIEHKVYEDSEWQANCFAAELLAPLSQCLELSVDEIMNKFNISRKCAEYRFKDANKK